MKRATEHEYLLWFRHNADFGPATEDVIEAMNNEFCRETGMSLPEGWEGEGEEDTGDENE